MQKITKFFVAVAVIALFATGIQAKSGYSVNAGGKTGDVVITG